MDRMRAMRVGQRVRILSGACESFVGTVIEAEDARQVANVALDQRGMYETTEEDYGNLEILEGLSTRR